MAQVVESSLGSLGKARLRLTPWPPAATRAASIRQEAEMLVPSVGFFLRRDFNRSSQIDRQASERVAVKTIQLDR